MGEEGRVVKKARRRGAWRGAAAAMAAVSAGGRRCCQRGEREGATHLVEDSAVVGRHAVRVQKHALLQALEAGDGRRDLDAAGEQIGQRGEGREQNQPEHDGDYNDEITPPAHNS